MHYKLALIGFGNVARNLARLLERKRSVLEERYNITFSLTGIATGRHGFAVNPNGLDVQKALELVESGKSIAPLSTFQVNDSLAVIVIYFVGIFFALDGSLNPPLHRPHIIVIYREYIALAHHIRQVFIHGELLAIDVQINACMDMSVFAAELLPNNIDRPLRFFEAVTGEIRICPVPT